MAVDPTKFSMTESYALVEGKLPFGKYLAPLALLLLIFAVIAWASTYLYQTILSPLAAAAAQYNGGPVGWRSFFVLAALVIVAVAVGWIILTRRLQAIDEQVAWVRSLAKLTDATQAKESTVYELMGRVSALEKHTRLMSAPEKAVYDRILKQEEEKLA